jgi:hypothetical protein
MDKAIQQSTDEMMTALLKAGITRSLIEGYKLSSEVKAAFGLDKVDDLCSSSSLFMNQMMAFELQTEDYKLLSSNLCNKSHIKEEFDMECHIRQYFQKLATKLGNSNHVEVILLPEKNDIRLGTYVHIRSEDLLLEKYYYIKVHSTNTRGNSVSFIPIDVKRVYAFYSLQQYGLTGEVHVFYDKHHEGTYYTAVEDTRRLDNNNSTGTEFFTLKELETNLLPCDASKINKRIIEGVERIYLVCKLLRLENTIADPTRFGFIVSPDFSIVTPRVLDFDIATDIDFNDVNICKEYDIDSKDLSVCNLSRTISYTFSPDRYRERVLDMHLILCNIVSGRNNTDNHVNRSDKHIMEGFKKTYTFTIKYLAFWRFIFEERNAHFKLSRFDALMETSRSDVVAYNNGFIKILTSLFNRLDAESDKLNLMKIFAKYAPSSTDCESKNE